MCLIVIAHQASIKYPFVLAANRDEFFSRPSAEANFWTNESVAGAVILGGRDLVQGGTWLGVTRDGRFAAVTNIRNPSAPQTMPRSRGELTRGFLEGSHSPGEYLHTLSSSVEEFAGFNLLLGDARQVFYMNNIEGMVRQLEPGIYGLSNGLLDSAWPKVQRAKDDMENALAVGAELQTDALLDLMNNRDRAEDGKLPDTGVPLELERALSSVFIHNPERKYGTRCSTAIIYNAKNNIRFSEQNYDEEGQETGRHFFELN
ncbi:MAG: NRDE family protein [Gammaproteobacteria bacterium]|jgi:uncharacterized protein with NRDE domain|nr:hypothetical protein [Gammaproteobacteria bacterium]MDP6096223.1 NRDE family protein [Gammaproteobacteria bacterium]HJO11230.1 NRDE family protein [Gammaproteobacteria bacterium]|tara:strand:+ start:613 stop:1392 length:780 start_codon:yes stop_codon:yes gene_type:complete